MFNAVDLFDLTQCAHAEIFDGCKDAWEVLGRIPEYIAKRGLKGLHNSCDGDAYIGKHVYIGEGTVVEDGAMIKGPAIIGRNCQIRHNAYIRENVILGNDCVLGNACEIKNSVMFNGAVAPHFNYIGDSVLGHKAHLGAGVKISNFKFTPGTIKVEAQEGKIDSGLRKFGALVGDSAEVGCNAVLNPGSILGRRSIVYPNVNWRGVLPSGYIAKNRSVVEISAGRTTG